MWSYANDRVSILRGKVDMNITSERLTLIILATVIFLSVFGCAQIRKLTYPESFTYIEKKEVENLMHKMNESIGRLDQLVAEASPSDTDQQEKVIAELGKLEGIAIQLSGGHTQTNQFVINDHIEGFMTDISTAKMFAKLDPPKYHKVTHVVNACAECHQFR